MRVFSCGSSCSSWPASDCVGHASGSSVWMGPESEGAGTGVGREAGDDGIGAVGGGTGGVTSSAAGRLARPRRLGWARGSARSCWVWVVSSDLREISMSGRDRRAARRGSVVRGATGVTAGGVFIAALGAVPTMRGGGVAAAGFVGAPGREGGGGGAAEGRTAGGGAEARGGGTEVRGGGGGREGWAGGGGGTLVVVPTSCASSAAAFASSSARSSASASDAASAARRSHLRASPRSPRAYIASAVDSAQATSSESSFFAGGIGTEPAVFCAIGHKASPRRALAASGTSALA